MARLIDVDALAKECCGRRCDFESCEKCIEEYAQYSPDGIGECDIEFWGEDVQNAPTIDAIPVEWLEEHDSENISDSDGNIYGRRYITISEALSMWQTEQEAR